MIRRPSVRLALRFLIVTCVLAPAARALPGSGLPPTSAAGAARLGRSGGALAADRALAVRYDGVLEYEGHLARPHATTSYRSTRRITVSGPDLARQDWTTWRDGDTTRTVESTLLAGGRVLHRDDAGAPWVELAGREAAETAWMVWSAVPALISARGLEAMGHGLTGGAVNDYRSRYEWPDPLGNASVDLDVVDRPFQVEAVSLDPWRGTVVHETHYYGETDTLGHVWADSVTTAGYPADAQWRLVERRVRVEANAALADLALPDSVRPAAPARTDTTPVVTTLAPHVWAIDLPDVETRSLLLEFADHLVLLETSCDVPHGERLRAAAAKRSAKPVRFVSFSHHHPDYTGGLRPFLADTATVVCASSNRAYVDEIAHWSFAFDPDRLWRNFPGGRRPAIDTLVAGRWRQADATNELVAIDIGEKSHHTDAYVVFWLPRARLLFEGDLGWFAAPAGLRASSRSVGLLQAIDEAGLAPATLTQGWTPGGTPPAIPMARLRELVAARSAK